MNPITNPNCEQVQNTKIVRNLLSPKITDFDFKVLSLVYKFRELSVTEICEKLDLSTERNSHFMLVKKILQKFIERGYIDKKESFENKRRRTTYFFNEKQRKKTRLIKLSGEGLSICEEKFGVGIMYYDLNCVKKR